MKDVWLLNQMPLNKILFWKDNNFPKSFLLSPTSLILNALLPLLVFLMPSQLGFHFWPDWSLLFGIRVDYLSPTIFVSDVAIFLIVLLVAIQIFLGERRQQFNSLKQHLPKRMLALVLLVALVNIVFAANPTVTLLFWLRILELLLFSLYIIFFNRLDEKKWFYYPLAFSIVVFGFLGILQFVKGGTLGGIFYFLGERSFTKASAGIALTEIFGREFLRAYSTFPHPNSFAGFFGLGVLILFASSAISSKLKTVIVSSGIVFLLFTFSRTVIFTLLAIFVIYLLFKKDSRRLASVAFVVLQLTFLVSLVMMLVFKNYDPLSISSQSVRYRLYSTRVSAELFRKSPFVGVGLNGFIPEMVNTFRGKSDVWFLQPVHNVYLLLLSETGIFGFVGAYLLLDKLIKQTTITQARQYYLPIVFILVTCLFDHYWLTLNQNRLLLTIFFTNILKNNKV